METGAVLTQNENTKEEPKEEEPADKETLLCDH